MHSRTLLAAVLVASAIAVSGCNDILSEQASQEGLIGDPIVTTQRCFFGGLSAAPPFTCEPIAITQVDETGQGMIAYQVPADVKAPGTLSGSTSTPGDQRTSSYSYSQSYTDQLQVTSPALAGMRWAGYISEPEFFTAAQHVPQVETISARFVLPRGAGGSLARGPFKWLTVVGLRMVNGTDLPANRPVGGCGPALATGYVTPGQASPQTDTWCGTYPTTLPAPSVLQTSDLGVTPPAPQSVPAGGAVDVPFGWELAGAEVGTPFSLSAQTDVPGASASPADTALNPAGDSKGTETVHLAVAPGTPPGDYQVALTARLPSGQQRSAAVPVHVDAAAQPGATVNAGTPLDRKGPRLTIAGRRGQKLKDALAHGVRLSLGCSESCTLVATLLVRARTSGSKAFSFSRAGHRSVRVRFSRKAARRLAKAKSVSLRVSVLGTDRTGNRSATARRLKLG